MINHHGTSRKDSPHDRWTCHVAARRATFWKVDLGARFRSTREDQPCWLSIASVLPLDQCEPHRKWRIPGGVPKNPGCQISAMPHQLCLLLVHKFSADFCLVFAVIVLDSHDQPLLQLLTDDELACGFIRTPYTCLLVH